MLVLGACGEEPDSGAEFASPTESRDWEEQATGPRRRDPDVTRSPHESSPRTARIGTWSIPEADPIWRRDSDLPGGRADISPLLERGLRLCE